LEEVAADDLWMDQEAAKKLTGIYTNRVFVQPLGDGLVRVNFGEVLDESEPTYHTALVMTAINAAAFAELIQRLANANITARAHVEVGNGA
jgi:hypothetical protein